MQKKTKTNWIERFDEHEIIIASTRYYAGRMTASTCNFAETLARAWPDLSDSTKSVIRRDLSELFRRDDFERSSHVQRTPFNPLPLGMDLDREAWEKVRKAWGNDK